MDYNQYMNGLDLADQYVALNPIFRNTLKQTEKVFSFLFAALYLTHSVPFKHLIHN